jgi:hypothetical protein
MQVNVQTAVETKSLSAPDQATLALEMGTYLRGIGYDEATARRNGTHFSMNDVQDGDTLVFTKN